MDNLKSAGKFNGVFTCTPLMIIEIGEDFLLENNVHNRADSNNNNSNADLRFSQDQ